MAVKPGHITLNNGGNKLFIADDNIVEYIIITLEYKHY